MYESLYPGDDIWDKFDIPPVSLYPDLLSADGTMDPPQVVPSHVMGGRHDCMWAGTCSSEQHQRQCCEPDSEPVVAVTVTVKVKPSSRSLLRTSRIRTRSASPRPETPSESEEDESPVCVGVCDSEDLSVAVPVSEVTGQIIRTTSEYKSLSPPPSPVPSFFMDHSYHLSKTTVTLDNLGVQTPSDSEEEIDVVSVGDREKLTSLPTNPSARDRQQLQRTVATAIKQRSSRGRKRSVPVEDDKRSHKRRRAREDGEDSNDKRNQHNNMERLRRIDLREAITTLRVLVPSVCKNDRAAKVLILKEAATYCHHLLSVRRRLMSTKDDLRRRQAQLAARVKELRLVNAKMRGSVDKSPRKKRMGSR